VAEEAKEVRVPSSSVIVDLVFSASSAAWASTRSLYAAARATSSISLFIEANDALANRRGWSVRPKEESIEGMGTDTMLDSLGVDDVDKGPDLRRRGERAGSAGGVVGECGGGVDSVDSMLACVAADTRRVFDGGCVLCAGNEVLSSGTVFAGRVVAMAYKACVSRPHRYASLQRTQREGEEEPGAAITTRCYSARETGEVGPLEHAESNDVPETIRTITHSINS
jgi:hypothetical protein